MSTTTLRPTASPAYQPRTFRPASPFQQPSTTLVPTQPTPSVPRSTLPPKLDYPLPSRPASPMPPNQTPNIAAGRLSQIPSAVSGSSTEHHHKGSSLRNEVDIGRRDKRKSSSLERRGKTEVGVESNGEVEEGEVREITSAMKRNAKDVLKLLSSLPAPLPEELPPNFLPTPRSTPSPSPAESFATCARTMSSTSPRSSSGSSSLGKRRRSSSPNPTQLVGLGLSDMSKKSKGMKGGASMTPTTSTFGFSTKTVSPEMKRPSTSTSISPIEGKETWSRSKWASAAASYKARAILLKRHGDAHLRLAGAKPQFLHLPADNLMGLLSLTDAVLLWLYAYWCDEQADGRVHMTPYRESQALREYVKGEWERWVRKGWNEYALAEEDQREGLRDMGKGMIGLMYLIEAVVYYHLSTEQLHHLNRRSVQINSTANSSGGPSSTHLLGSTSTTTSVPHVINPPTNTTSPSSNSPPEQSPSTSNPSIGPSPKSTTSNPEIPKEIMDLITTSTSQASRAASNLLNSRHHLPLSLLRSKFPGVYEIAITSELADESLPPPNDSLGAARKVDIDVLERFVWPIELGMCAPMAHLAVFGRGLVREFGETAGREWDTQIGVEI